MAFSPKPAWSFGGEADFYVYANQQEVFLGWMLICFLIDPDNEVCEDPVKRSRVSGKGATTTSTTWDTVFSFPLTDKVRLGVIAGTGESSFRWPAFDHRFNSDTTTGGGFAAFNFAPDWLLNVLGTYTDSDTRMHALGSTARFSTKTTLIQAELLRRFGLGNGAWTDVSGGVAHIRSKRDAFTDTLFAVFEPATKTSVTRLRAGGRVGKLFPMAHACNGAGKCENARGFVGLDVFHDSVDIVTDPTLPIFDTNYFGAIGSAGFQFPVNYYISLGGRASVFTGGDLDGYMLQGVIDVKFWELITGRPLLEKPLLDYIR